MGEETSTEVRCIITSLPADDAAKFAEVVRKHWTVGNDLHWVLDVAFDENHSRVREDNAPENMAMLRHMALNLLKADTVVKRGVQTRKRMADWDARYLAQPRLPRRVGPSKACSPQLPPVSNGTASPGGASGGGFLRGLAEEA
ncbi:MAG: ISAs1 family transposase [Myxococcota bacterium]